MRIALTPEQMKAVDRYMIDRMKIPGIVLMENAAHGVYEAIREEAEPCTVQVFCGTGNNGGDGFAVARILLANGYDVHVVVLGNLSSLSEDAAANFAFFKENEEYFTVIANKEAFDALSEAEVYVDAIFGTGLARRLDGIYRDAVEYLNGRDALVVAVDIPTGVNAQTGAVMGDAVKADITVTFQYPKIGHFLQPGRTCTGELQVVKIGVDEGCDVPIRATVCAYESDDADMCIGERPLDSNKGDYGRLLLVAGSYGMAGAAVLSARAASRAGAGLVNVASCGEVIDVLQQNVPEATCFELASQNGLLAADAVYAIEKLAQGKTAIAAGPGLGVNEDIAEVVGNILTNYDLPKVIDADALNALAEHLEFLENKKGDVILTPHPKEFARLSGLAMSEIMENPVRSAVDFAVEYGITLVLKGSTTVIADAFGNASLMCVGSPGMAKGGSGDVLTGVIGGLLAQGKDAYEAALAGVYITGLAGELAATQESEYSMTPMDTVNSIGQAIKTMLVDYVQADLAEKKGEQADVPRRAPQRIVEEHVQVPIEAPVFRQVKEPIAPVVLPEEEKIEEIVEPDEAVFGDEAVDETVIWKLEPEQQAEAEFPKHVQRDEKVKEPTMDFLEKYADEPEPMSRVQRRNEKGAEKKPLFRRTKVKDEETASEEEFTPQNVKDEIADELPSQPEQGPTRRRIG